ncbi:MAG: hypothetical protein MUF72_02085 [Elainella sp. Prado103]|jgi:hypothetical protein|nr:hypothetical protein [Elainella sp. Prado103]
MTKPVQAYPWPNPDAPSSRSKRRSRFRALWFERFMALLALSNLLLVLFDWSYLYWRHFYFHSFPALTQRYDAIKGIEPHRDTTAYLQAVAELKAQVALTGLQSGEVTQQLTQLQSLSTEMINQNPFAVANQSGTLERIKNRMRDRIGEESAKIAFQTFWSTEYLTTAGWQNAIDFFEQELQPLLDLNYYRGISETGQPIDRFWQIDLWFMGIFALEFLARTFYLSRRYQYISWLDAVIWRGYDLFLFLPFWRWLRVIPVLVRLDQAKLVNFHPINNRLVHTLISSVAVELTEMVVLRILDQVQALIRQGEVSRWLLQNKHYIDLNGVNELEGISKHFIEVFVYQVLPRLQPEVEALLQHSLTQALQSSPVYSGLQRLPGVSLVSNQLTQQLVSEVTQNTYQVIQASLADQTGAALMSQLISRLGEAFSSELKQSQALEQIESLSVALLEEIKVNYVERLQAEDYEKLRAEKQRIYGISRSPR